MISKPEIPALNELLMKSLPFGIDIVDKDGQILYMNEAFRTAVRSEPVGKKCWELYRDNKEQCDSCPLREEIHVGETKTIETNKVLGGRIFTVTHTGIVFGGQLAVLEFFYDVTDQKIMEQELAVNENKYRSLVENSPDMLYSFSDVRGGFYYSKRVEDILGWTAEYMMENPFTWANAIHPDDQSAVQNAVNNSKRGYPVAVKYRMSDRHGNWKWIYDRSALQYTEEGETIIDGIASDITEQHQIELLNQLQADRARVLLELPHIAEHVGEIDFLQSMLEQVELITGSTISFAHFINEDQQTIELVTWSKRTLKEYCHATHDKHYPAREAGLWAEALRTKTSVVINDYFGAINKKGLPTGHAQLNRLISLPIVDHDRVVMIVGVGNKADDYTQHDVDTVQLLSDTAWRIASRKRNEVGLKRAANVFSHAREGIVITDALGHILEVNEMFTQITGYEREDVVGKNPSILKSGKQGPEFYAIMWKSLIEKGHWYGEIWNKHKNGAIYAEMLTISTVKDDEGTTENYVALFTDITPMKEHQAQLEHIAHYDALTGLPNRVLLADRMSQALVHSQRRATSAAVIYLDLDGFKGVNDEHSHDVGDQLLVTISQKMKNCLREGDTFARIGGDEFIALLVDLDNDDNCEQVLGRLLLVAAENIAVGDLSIKVSTSIGITIYPQDNVDADMLIRHADQAMYIAKQTGKNKYHRFDTVKDAEIQTNRETLVHIKQALDNDEFVLFYQPKVNMNGRIIGAEALIRWNHPTKGILSPATFLPIIEDHPLSIDMGEWVIGKALVQLIRWHSAGLEITISVNVGARQLQQNNFVQRIEHLLSTHPLANPSWLELEVLETSALEDVAHVARVMLKCKDLGIKFALDDFGTGYSSLSYLNKFHLDHLKIDQSFVRNLTSKSTKDLALCEAIIAMSHKLGMQVVAEGIETVEQRDLLFAAGIDYGQGYLFSRPIPPEDFVKLFMQMIHSNNS